MTESVNREYQIGPELGRGRFGTVREITSLSTDQTFALKTVTKSLIPDPFDLDSALNEPKFLARLRDVTNVVTLHSSSEDPTSLHLVLDLCDGPTLLDLIVSHGNKGPLPEPLAARVLRDLLLAVAACHSRGVAHRDIKPDNVLFDGSGRLKLADFGSAAWFDGEDRRMSGLVGTVAYVAPEVARGDGEYGEKVDVWSCGVVLYAMLSGGVMPFGREGETAAEVLEAVARGNVRFPTRVFGGVSREAKDLMRKMMCRDASRRLSAEQVLKHPWFEAHVTK